MSKSVVLITGALTGIGRATAFAFAQEGARVVVSGRRDDAGEALAIELRATASPRRERAGAAGRVPSVQARQRPGWHN
jgi:NAD(P)-dependent dehydrogenase (short-subunit alcohol dehydrogenase family)